MTSVKPVPFNRLKAGVVVWVHVPFADVSGEKIRPAIVLSASSHSVEVLPVTTSPRRFNFPHRYVEVEEWAAAGLVRPSGVRRQPISVDRRELVGVAGTLSESDLFRILSGDEDQVAA